MIVAVGVRANVVKVAPLFSALSSAGIDVQIALAGDRDSALSCGQGFVSVFGVTIPEPTWYIDGGADAGAPIPVLMPDSDKFAAALSTAGLKVPANTILSGAVPHLHMLLLIRSAKAVITDSGGVQEEACILCSPCVTVRSCTEHESTVSSGVNALVASKPDIIGDALLFALEHRRNWAQPARWDRAVSDRVVRAIKRGILPLQ